MLINLAWIHIVKIGGIIDGITPKRSVWLDYKPEVEFQYGGCLFSETESSNISAVDRDILSKFGVQIDLRFLNECRHKTEAESRFATLWPPS